MSFQFVLLYYLHKIKLKHNRYKYKTHLPKIIPHHCLFNFQKLDALNSFALSGILHSLFIQQNQIRTNL